MTLPIRAALLSGVVLLAGCSDRAEPGPQRVSEVPDTGGIAVVAVQNAIDFLNPLATGERYTQEILRHALLLPLLEYDEELDYRPMLARAYELLDDTAVVFHIRNDVRWHDGKPTTAYDVAFTFQRAANKETAYPNLDFIDGWGPPQVIDSFTVRFKLERMPDPLSNIPFFPIVPEHLLDTVPLAGMKKTAFNRNPVGNGPFRFVEYRTNDRLVLEANREFPEELGGRPPLDRLIIRIIPEAAAQMAELKTGGVDLIASPRAGEFKTLDSLPNLRGITRESRNYAFIPINMKRPVLSDARFRRGLAMALNRSEMLNVLRGGYGRLALGPVGPFHWAYHENLEPLPYSSDSARALFIAAGLRDVNGDNILEGPDGKPFVFELKVPASSSFNRDLAAMIQSDAADAGLRVNIRTLDFNTIIEDISGPERKFDGALMGWETDFRLSLRDLFHTEGIGGPFQFSSYSNPEVDSLIDRTTRITDREQALPLWHRLQEVMREDQPWLFLYYFPELYVVNERLRGVQMDIRGAFTNVHNWWIQQ